MNYHSLYANDTNITLSDNTYTYFILEKQDNKSYLIKIKDTDKYLTINNNQFSPNTKLTDEYKQQFYIESESLFIENKSEYTEDGEYITKTIDARDNETIYDIDKIKGLTNSITNANNVTTEYTYNNTDQIEKVKSNNHEVIYNYENYNLNKIIQGNKQYIFNYDNFLNKKEVRLGNNIKLIENIYENNNGNLIKSKYGNNHVIDYTYDNFDRINKTIKMDDTYEYKY